MQEQAAINTANSFADELHKANEADISYKSEAEDEAGEREAWER
jgi:hypothetical protein